jgi:hypothetical protein
MTRPLRTLAVLRTLTVIGAVALTVGVVTRGISTAAPLGSARPAALTWAPASTATVHPGVETFTDGSQCTANFVFTDGTNVYIGQAAHCAGTGGDTDTNGCTSPTLPVGTAVTISGASKPGTLVYSSWATMQADHETDANTCAYNDLALVKIDPSDVGNVNPTIPVWGGPQGVSSGGTTLGERVFSYGNSILRLGVTALSPKEGISEGDTGAGWSTAVLTATPGIPGDSGSAFLDASGDALGILSTLGVSVPGGVTNNIGNVGMELAYMHAHSSFSGVDLVNGTSAFNADAVPLNASQPVDPNALQNLQDFVG